MLMDIFSSFDEQNFTILKKIPLIWMMSALPLYYIQSLYWSGSSRWAAFVIKIKGFMMMQAMRTKGGSMSGFNNAVISIFMMLIIMNLLGLSPYVFSITSHLVFAFSFGLPLWFALILSGVFFNLKSVVSHFLPSGAPSVLNPFLVLVETVSISVRPITLSIRLTANMSAGHIILGLIGAYLSAGIFSYSSIIILLLIFIEIFYFMFEVGVSLIQAYIFSLLITLYSDDHPEL
ncbi:ATP synthase F0 subunit 6 (mitochondrion) [Liolophura japonica]|uniref:ATP synthase F0 subunit 6 n=1 Tax=Liolophura japonica TaxID=13599 RepID=UPI0023D8C46D|nr:ATP synthase F0 subunit 6 [Liolophura japonica]WDQ44256.1 ATP synthase F0 subunit 6 [Liolophura japonica]